MISRYDPAAAFAWWGPTVAPRRASSLAELVGGAMLGTAAAALLAACVARRLSLVVVAEAAGIGKTALLTAALAHLPTGTRSVFLRGRWETFAAVLPPGGNPARDALLVNEIAPHAPVYLWGEAVTRLCRFAAAGFPIYATAHARDAADLCKLLTAPPFRVAAADLAAIDLVAALAPGLGAGRGRLTDVWAVGEPDGSGAPVVHRLGGGDDATPSILAALAAADAAGWRPCRGAPGPADLRAAAARLGEVFDLGAAGERPGAMLARSRLAVRAGVAGLP